MNTMFKNYRIIAVPAKNKLIASSEFFGKKDLGRPIRPFSVKPIINHKLYSVKVRF